MVTAMQVVNNGHFCQESYETATREAGIRAKELRAAGYEVSVGSIGPQVTPLGTIRVTLVTIRKGRNRDTFYLPEINRVEWPR